MHKDLIPPKEYDSGELDRFKTAWIAEADVITALKELGHNVETLGIDDEITPLATKIKEKRPSLVFNMLEQFNNDPAMDYHIVTLLELHQLTYTGCNPKGLLLSRDKALAKKILKYHKIATPNFVTIKKNEKIKGLKKLQFPLIVKCALEEASYGLAQASVVNSTQKLVERVHYIQKDLAQDVLIEEFVEGREIYVGVIGNKRLKVLPTWELKYRNVANPEKEVYTERAKWNQKYRQRKGIDHCKAEISPELEAKIQKIAKKVYKVLNLSGYARIDFRVDKDERVYVLEANPNPNIASDDEFAESAKHAGLSYNQLLKNLISAGQRPNNT
ncbi:MAG: ATP-grasp domain-containing protein [Bacteriovoracaceae bacterium]|nr:ATP-grasp domain-containing protein [Bacteriovoracaceae bacterium]